MNNDPEIFRQEVLTEIALKYKSSGTPLLNRGILATRNIDGKSYQWDEKTELEDVGAFVGDDDPANVVDDEPMGNRAAKLITSFDEARIDGDQLQQMRKAGGVELKTHEDQVAEKLNRLSDIHMRQDEFLLSQAIQGSIATKIKRMPYTINFGLPAGNHFKIGGGGGNGNLPLSWGNAAAKVHEDLENMRKIPRETAGRELTLALMGPGVKMALFGNEATRDLINSTPTAERMADTAQIPNLYGFTWVEVLHRYKDPISGNMKYHIPFGKVVFLPPPDRSWGEFTYGTVVVKNSSGQLVKVTRAGAWSAIADNPPAAVVYRRYRRCPVLKNMKTVITAQVLPAA